MIFTNPYEFRDFARDKNDLLTVPQISEIVNGVDSLLGEQCCCGAAKNMGKHIENLYLTMGNWLGQEHRDLIKAYLGADEVVIGRYGKVYLTF